MSMAYVGFPDTTFQALINSTKIVSRLPVAFVGFWLKFRHTVARVKTSLPVMDAG